MRPYCAIARRLLSMLLMSVSLNACVSGIVGPHGTVGIGIEGEGSTTAEKIGRATAIYLPAMPPDTIRP